MQPQLTITEEAVIRIRDIFRPGTWSRLTLEQKLMVVQLALGACTFVLLVVLVFGP